MKLILNFFKNLIDKFASFFINIGRKVCNLSFFVRFAIIILFIALLAPIFFYRLKESKYARYIYENIDDIPQKRIAVVFGAGVGGDSSPSPILRDRILTSVELYKAGKVEKIIMSGDNSIKEYDKPSVMINYAIENGVPEHTLQPDYAGRRTYDTCYRAKNIFDLNEAILITQRFHLTRALYLCNSLGIESIGLASDLNEYQGMDYMQARDIYALALAFIDIEFRKPEVIPGEKIEI